MKIAEIVALTTILLVSFSFFTTIEADSIGIECEGNRDCPRSLACQDNVCTDMCEFLQEKGRICRMKHHKPSFTCARGYKFARGSGDNRCFPKAWRCYVDKKDPDEIIKCNSPNWHCKKSHEGVVSCRILGIF